MINAIYTIWLREMKRFIRSKSRIIGNISMPFIWLAIMGVGLNSTFTIPGINISYLNYMAPGIIGMTLLFTSIFSGLSVIWDKQFGFLKEILVSPIPRISIVLGKIAGSSTISIINALIILIISISMGAIYIKNLTIYNIVEAIIFMILISISFVSIGLAIASRLDNMEGFQVIMSFLVMPIFFLSGAFFPIENVPNWMKVLAFIDPLMYGVDGLRGSLLGISKFSIWIDFLILFVFSVSIILLSTIMFKKFVK